MPKLTLEYTDDERREALLAFRANELMYALNEVANLRRDVYKCRFYGDDSVNVKDNIVITDEMWQEKVNEFVEKQNKGEKCEYPSGGSQYIKNQTILDRLDEILDDVRDLLDY